VSRTTGNIILELTLQTKLLPAVHHHSRPVSARQHGSSLPHQLIVRLVLHQFFLGPSDVYTRPAAPTVAEPAVEPTPPRRPSLTPNASRFSIRRGSSSFSRLSYGIHEEAELDDVKQILEGKQEDSIVGAMFGYGAFEQVKSSWWL